MKNALFSPLVITIFMTGCIQSIPPEKETVTEPTTTSISSITKQN